MNDSKVNKPRKDTQFHSPSILTSIIQTAELHMLAAEVLMNFFQLL